MSTIAEQIAKQMVDLAQGDASIRSAIAAQGVAVPSGTRFVQLGDKIAQIEGGGAAPAVDYGWSRPADRPALPFEGEPEENSMYMLFGVEPLAPNDMAVRFTASGGYTVDWGDGNVDTSASNTNAEHIYDYDSLAVTPNSIGLKFVWIKCTPTVEGNSFTSSIVNVRHSSRSATGVWVYPVYELYLNAPLVTSWQSGDYAGLNRFSRLQVFDWVGENQLTAGTAMLSHMTGLRKLRVYTGRMLNLSYFMYSVNGANPADMDFLDTSKVTSTSTSNFSHFQSYSGTLTIDLSSYPEVSTNNFHHNTMTGLKGLRFKNMNAVTTTVPANNQPSLDVTALVNLFNDLYDRTGLELGTINITGCFGTAALTDAQRAIATEKNWKITPEN